MHHPLHEVLELASLLSLSSVTVVQMVGNILEGSSCVAGKDFVTCVVDQYCSSVRYKKDAGARPWLA